MLYPSLGTITYFPIPHILHTATVYIAATSEYACTPCVVSMKTGYCNLAVETSFEAENTRQAVKTSPVDPETAQLSRIHLNNIWIGNQLNRGRWYQITDLHCDRTT